MATDEMSIPASVVKELRGRSGAGMMECKKALVEVDSDIEKAIDLLRAKGAAAAAKRAGREAKEGLVEAYIHPGSRLGVLVEVNCETDFVARTDDFKAFARSVAMQIAASNPAAVRREDIPEADVDREREIYVQQARETGKPEAVIEKIITGKLDKWFKEICLLEQADIRDSDRTVSQMVTEIAAKLGENIGIRQFSRFQLGA